MYRIRIISIGKTKESWLEEAIGEYTKRLQGTTTIEYIWADRDDQLISFVDKDAVKGAKIICLDPKGEQFTSEAFSKYLLAKLEEGGSRATFVIGGAEGLPSPLRQKYPLVSFSLMTFTHQMTRLVLVEQIYRALEIAKGTKYHK